MENSKIEKLVTKWENIKKNYKCKRPKKGYNTEKERGFAKWSGVSEWEVYYKNNYIGYLYYTGTLLVDWSWTIEKSKHIQKELSGTGFTKKDVFENLITTYQKEIN